MQISRTFSKFLIIGCIVSASVPTLFAQEQGGGRPGRGGGGPGGPGGGRGMRMGGGFGGGGLSSLLRMKEVRDELKIDEDQGKELDVTAQEMMKEMQTLFQENPGAPPDMTKMREMQVKVESKLEEILDPKQIDRLIGLLVQRDGARSINTAIVATRLKVTEEQKAQMADVEKAAGEAMRGLFSGGAGGPPSPDVMEKMQTMRKENDEKMAAILTAEQKAEMEAMKGEKFEFPAPQFGPGGPGGPGGGGGRGRGGNRPGA